MKPWPAFSSDSLFQFRGSEDRISSRKHQTEVRLPMSWGSVKAGAGFDSRLSQLEPVCFSPRFFFGAVRLELLRRFNSDLIHQIRVNRSMVEHSASGRPCPGLDFLRSPFSPNPFPKPRTPCGSDAGVTSGAGVLARAPGAYHGPSPWQTFSAFHPANQHHEIQLPQETPAC